MPSGHEIAGPPRVVLIVDDDPDFVALLRHCLPEPVFQVHHCPYGEKGLEEARRLKPHLILLDIMMPGIHGLHVLQALRAEEETARIRIFVTSNVMPRREVESRLVELDADFVDKGLPIREITSLIERTLGIH
ncbi:MAG: hypothetical protein A2X36_12805 [Elusimicrobia bacterium GWA2_69_24]|nr:MAG: hypothetical protein A2X36_12805 [Elusimicrobia bacterium GWA2_69_24]